MPDRIDVRDAGRSACRPARSSPGSGRCCTTAPSPGRPGHLAVRGHGAVERPVSLTWDELLALPRQETACDMHCVTRWSRYDNVFEGVPVQALLARAGVKPGAAYVLVHAEQGYTTNLPLADLDRPANLLALTHNGEPLTPEHGGPVRLLVPHLYLWKSAKWVTRVRAAGGGRPGLLGAERLPHAGRSVAGGALWAAGSGADAPGTAVGSARRVMAPSPVRAQGGLGAGQFNSFKSCFWRPTRFSCLAWQNRPDVRRPRRRRTSGSPTSCARRTAGRGRLRGPSCRPSGPSASGWPRWWPTSGTTWRRCPSRRRRERSTVLSLVADRLRSKPVTEGLESAPEGARGAGAPLDRLLGHGRLGPDRVDHHRHPVPGRAAPARCPRASGPIRTGPTTSWRGSSPRCARSSGWTSCTPAPRRATPGPVKRMAPEEES